MARRNILLIGAGGWGGVHLRAYLENRAWRVCAIADTSPETLAAAGERTDLPAKALYDDPVAALESAHFDAISVVVRNPHKIPILCRALETGKPVLTEKPLTHSLPDLKLLYKSVRRSQNALMVSQNYRFEPQARRMAEFVRTRRQWGAPYAFHVEFVRNIREFGDHPVRRLSGLTGLGAEMCIHHYDLLRYILGANPIFLEARARRIPDSAMDGFGTLDVRFEFPDDLVVNYHADYEAAASRTPWGGEWRMDFRGGSLTWHPYADGQIPIQFHTPWGDRWSLAVHSAKSQKCFATHLVGEVFAEFSHAIAENHEFECALRDNAESLAMHFAVEKSVRTGKRIDFSRFLTEVTNGCP